MFDRTTYDNCTRCGRTLEDVFEESPRRRASDVPQKKHALVLEISGGYGMYIDQPTTTIILCKTCADDFFNENWYMKRFIRDFE